jgi:hypothetical protein
MGKFTYNFFESVGIYLKKIRIDGKFSNIFESVVKFSKFENLPVAHHMAHALRVSFLKFSPATPPVDHLFSFPENKRK